MLELLTLFQHFQDCKKKKDIQRISRKISINNAIFLRDYTLDFHKMTSNLNAQQIVGFVDGEGCFRVSILKNKQIRFKMQLQAEFVITQHTRDPSLLKEIQTYFNCSQISLSKGKNRTNCSRFRIRKLSDLCNIIVPFFEKIEFKNKKNKMNFLNFEKCVFF